VDSILQLETNVDALQGEDIEASRLQVALYRVTPGSTQFPASQILKRTQTIRLCEMVCAYRFIDVLYNLQAPETSTFEHPIYPKRRLTDYLPTQV
jgi:hypothetical protein